MNGPGAIVAPPTSGSVTLALSDVSAFKGIAMNAAKSGRGEDSPDFEAIASSVPFGADNTARLDVDCWDYGGFATATVTHAGSSSPSMRIPGDLNGNWLPDAGWDVTFGNFAHIADTGLGTGVDEDNAPPVSGPVPEGFTGDGFVNFEEFRGFLVRGEHRRTNPFHKDLFISSDLGSPVGITFAFPNLPTATHRINGQDESGTDEYRTADRVVNWKYQNAGAGGDIPNRTETNGQKALRVMEVEVNLVNPMRFGSTFSIPPTPAQRTTPNETDRIEVYRRPHQELKKPPRKFNNTEINNELSRTLAHEVGHGVHICHRDGTQCPDDATVGTSPSVMNSM
jgi:hypothetical protein